MQFLNSDKVKVFPCGGRNSTYDPQARLTTEYNLVSIINRLVDKKSFIVTTNSVKVDVGNTNNPQPLSINIGGYLFNIDSSKSILNLFSEDLNKSENKYIVANIKIDSYKNGDVNYQQLKAIEDTQTTSDGKTTYESSLDINETFKGLSFNIYETLTISNDEKTLILFEKRSDGWYQYEDSKLKFETDTYGNTRSVKIDDGFIRES